MSAFEDASLQFKKAAEFLSLSSDTIDRLQKLDRLIKKELVIKMDDGSKKKFLAFRCQHSNLLGPYKGGVRFHPDLNEDEIKALATWMTIKTAIAGIPYGGGKGGVQVDPHKLSDGELKRISQSYADAMASFIGPWKDIPAPDMNTNSQTMAWMVGSYQKWLEKNKLAAVINSQAAFTGKPIALGGSQGREEATGLGGFYILQELMKKFNKKPYEISIAVQGFGNVAYWFAKFAADAGYKIIAISNSNKGLLVEKGMNPEKVYECYKKTGELGSCACVENSCHKTYGKTINNEDLLSLDVDVLVPAAIDGVITKKNIHKIKAPIILELANGPTTVEAEEIFLKNSKNMIIPDVLTNAGGVIVSYFEWVQNLQAWYWDKAEVFDKLQLKMMQNFDIVWQEFQQKDISFRIAAYLVALKRLIEADKLNQ